VGQCLVREREEERAQEIAGEFYPQNKELTEEQICEAVGSSENAEQYATICELARRLGFTDEKIRILFKRCSRNTVGVERKLRNQLGECPENVVSREGESLRSNSSCKLTMNGRGVGDRS
jgi:hypothetical protein